MIDYKVKFDLEGKKIVVAGGAGLIGSQTVTAIAQLGAYVVIADTDRSKGKSLANKLSQNGLDVVYKYFDITDVKRLDKNLGKLIRDIGGLDVWVNSAYPRTDDWGAKVEDISYRSWCENINLQLNSYALASRCVAIYMKKKGGSIINFGSIYGVRGPDLRTYGRSEVKNPMAYAAIKGGIVNLTRYLASYFGRYNIRANTICPGGVFDNQDPAFVKKYSERVPLGRMAKAEEIASVAAFLASDAAAYITGATIMVDGGWTAI